MFTVASEFIDGGRRRRVARHGIALSTAHSPPITGRPFRRLPRQGQFLFSPAFPLDLDSRRSESASDFRFVGYFSEATFRSPARKRRREKVGETEPVSATKTRRYGRANHATGKKVNERPSQSEAIEDGKRWFARWTIFRLRRPVSRYLWPKRRASYFPRYSALFSRLFPLPRTHETGTAKVKFFSPAVAHLLFLFPVFVPVAPVSRPSLSGRVVVRFF